MSYFYLVNREEAAPSVVGTIISEHKSLLEAKEACAYQRSKVSRGTSQLDLTIIQTREHFHAGASLRIDSVIRQAQCPG